jgi:hypothetical protein
MKDRAPQMPFTYSSNIVMGIKSNAANQSVEAMMRENYHEHCAHEKITENPFYPVGLNKDGKR